jgi:hypothetical protein
MQLRRSRSCGGLSPFLCQSADQCGRFVVGDEHLAAEIPRLAQSDKSQQATFFEIIITRPAKAEERVWPALGKWKELWPLVLWCVHVAIALFSFASVLPHVFRHLAARAEKCSFLCIQHRFTVFRALLATKTAISRSRPTFFPQKIR